MEEKIKSIYSPMSTILKELEKRSLDTALQNKVKNFFREYPIPGFDEEPRAVISRSIITPNKELDYFIDISKAFNLKPLFMEYDNKFIAKNIEKYHLCRLYFCEDFIKNKYHILKIVDFNKWEGSNLHAIQTTSGESLKKIHLNLMTKKYPQYIDHHIDITKWFNDTRTLDETYYFYFLSLFIVNGVLFDNYLTEDSGEREFFEKKVYPAFQKVTEYFGVKPLIFPLLPLAEENRKEWLYYDDSLVEML